MLLLKVIIFGPVLRDFLGAESTKRLMLRTHAMHSSTEEDSVLAVKISCNCQVFDHVFL